VEDNIFNFNEPDEYYCQVVEYTRKPSLIRLIAAQPEQTHRDNVYVVEFNAVRFFEGPTYWRGGNFTRTDPTPYMNFLIDLGYNEPTDLVTSNGYSLFEVDYVPATPAAPASLDHKVRILAKSCLIYQAPEEYFYEEEN